MLAGDDEVPPCGVGLDSRLCVWSTRHFFVKTVGHGSLDIDMDAGAAGGVFRVTGKLVEDLLCPGVDAAIRVHAMIQVHAGEGNGIAIEDKPQAIILV